MLLPVSRATNSPPDERGELGLAAAARQESATSTATELDIKTNQVSSGRIRRLQILILALLAFFGYFAWRTTRSQEMLQQTALSQGQSVDKLASSVANDGKRIETLASAVHDLTAAISKSVGTLKGFEDELGKRDEQLTNFSARLNAMEVETRKRRQLQENPPPEIHTPATVGPMPSLSRPASPSNAHVHQFDLSIPHANNTVVHYNAEREADYWLALKVGPNGVKTERVEPFGTNSEGVKVHNLEDGCDYILTPTGDWVALFDK